jgi:hypothetical protein
MRLSPINVRWFKIGARDAAPPISCQCNRCNYTAGGSGARFMGIVHHTDAAREWAYDRQSHIGKLEEGTMTGPVLSLCSGCKAVRGYRETQATWNWKT